MARDIIDDRMLGALHLQALNRRGFEHDPTREHQAFQTGTLNALMQGRYDGDCSLATLLAHGDLGIGTIQHLGGELVIVDGEAFVVRDNGAVEAVEGDTLTPFAVVTPFHPKHSAELSRPTTLADLYELIEQVAGGDGQFLAVRVDGVFSNLRLRSVAEQSPPYAPLTEVTKHQTEWSVDHSEGTLVGFRFPDLLAGLEVPGFHLHFLSDDRTVGGHVMAATTESGTVRIDGGDELHVELPSGVGLGTPGAADRAAVFAAEGGAPS